MSFSLVEWMPLVVVDPETLRKVFKELVSGRHECMTAGKTLSR